MLKFPLSTSKRMASDQLSDFLEVLRSNPQLAAAMESCLDVDHAVDLANQHGFALARSDLLTMDARMTFDELGIHGALKRNRSIRYRHRHE
jgi:hypothetical protein